MNKIPKIILAICLFILDIIYSFFVVKILQEFNIDITTFANNKKYFALMLIDISFMILIFLVYRKDLIKNISNYFKNFGKYFKTGFKYWIIGLLIMIISNIIINIITPGQAVNEKTVQTVLKAQPLYMIFATIIYAPFVEELIFRKSIRDIISNDTLYILISGFIFGYVHTLSGSSPSELLYILPYGALGASFAYMYVKTKNIFVSMTFHLIHNGILVFFSLVLIPLL